MSTTSTAQATLLYGATGTRKTTQVANFINYIYELTGLPTRIVSAENAGAEPLMPYIDMGMAEVLWLSRDMSPRAALRKISRGLWPKMDKDGIPQRDLKGQLIWLEPGGPGNDLGRWGGYAFEGLTSFADLIKQSLQSQFASGSNVTGKMEGAGLSGAGYEEDGEKFGTGSPSQVGANQDSIMELVREAPKNLYAKSGGGVIHCLFTAHESKGIDDITQQPSYGPGTVGKAITGKLFKEFGTALHGETEIVKIPATAGNPNAKPPIPATPETTKPVIWAYYQKHADSENRAVLWDCKARIPAIPEAVQMLEQKFPGGRFALDFETHLGTYLKFQDRAREMAMASLEKRKAAFMASRPIPTALTATANTTPLTVPASREVPPIKPPAVPPPAAKPSTPAPIPSQGTLAAQPAPAPSSAGAISNQIDKEKRS